MAPSPAGARRERVRCVWRARRSLADACADEGVSSSDLLARRLRRAVAEAQKQVVEDAPTWSSVPGSSSRLRVPQGYFSEFAEQVVRSINLYGRHESQERTANYQHRLEENTRAFLRELDVYNERMAPGARKSRMTDRKAMEQELYLWEPLQYWDDEQQAVMRHIIAERLAKILPNIAALLEAGALKPKPAEQEEESEAESELDVSMMDDKQREEYERRKRRDAELKAARAHQDAMNKILQETKQLTRANEELQRQLEKMREAVEVAEAERDRLLKLKAQLENDIKVKNDRRKNSLEAAKRAGENSKKAAAAAAAKAAADAKAQADAQKAVTAAASKIGDSLFVYTWDEQLKRSLLDELEEERTSSGIGKDEWQRRLVILNKHGKEVKLPVDFALIQNQFYMTVVMRPPEKAPPPKKVLKASTATQHQEVPKPKPPDKDELARRVADALRAAEAEQAKERAKLLARIKELEDAIAALQNMSDSDGEEVVGPDGRREVRRKQAKKKAQPEEEPPPGQHSIGGGTNWKAPPAPKLSGVVEITKTKVNSYKARGIFERLHGEASSRDTRCVIQQPAAAQKPLGVRLTGDTGSEESSVPSQFLFSDKTTHQGKRAMKSSLENLVAAAKAQAKRPSSAAKLSTISSSRSRRGSSATQRRNTAWHAAGWQLNQKKLDDLVPSGPMTLEGVLQQREVAETNGFGGHVAASQFIGTDSGAAILEKVPSNASVPQWGASVLHNRNPGDAAATNRSQAELAGTTKMPLLRRVFEQHLQDTTWAESS